VNICDRVPSAERSLSPPNFLVTAKWLPLLEAAPGWPSQTSFRKLGEIREIWEVFGEIFTHLYSEQAQCIVRFDMGRRCGSGSSS